MNVPVYDFRTDVRNVLVTPQIRARFLQMQPGQVAQQHSHDLGHEVFLVLSGRAVFEVEGESVEMGPGQMCVVLADQKHSVRVVGDEPMTMYLSVTPHVQPTHTMRTPDGERLPHRFMPSSAYDVEADITVPVEALIDRHVAAAQALAEAAQACAQVQQERAAPLKKSVAEGNNDAASRWRAEMWEAIDETFQKVYELADAWNDLAPRVGETK